MKDNKQNSNYKYFAFISYNSKDIKWGKRLQRKLEEYKMPAALCSERGWERRPIKPIFFAATDIQPGGLIESDVPLNENSIVMPCDKYTVITVMGNQQ